MKQYLDLLKEIKSKGTYKAAARTGMPGTTALFGYQFRHKLSEGFPLLTTKKLSFKNIGVELLWFLKGDTNIKYLVDNGCNIWNEDAYNFYMRKCKQQNLKRHLSFELFCSNIKNSKNLEKLREDSWINAKNEESLIPPGYILGDCGHAYGYQWRWFNGRTDQIKELVEGLIKNPEGRRHIVSSWAPNDLDNVALPPCHALFQLNCRPLKVIERLVLWEQEHGGTMHPDDQTNEFCDKYNIPKYYLDCQMYQRSADVFLGVPYNIASYALLVHIFAKITNMIPGDFIHTFGDVHIYDNHMEQVDEQLKRKPTELPILKWSNDAEISLENGEVDIDAFLEGLEVNDFLIENYNPQSAIKAVLSTGLNKI